LNPHADVLFLVCRFVSKEDEWTVCTVDGSRAAQYEHMILITADGVEVLTDSERFPEFSA